MDSKQAPPSDFERVTLSLSSIVHVGKNGDSDNTHVTGVVVGIKGDNA